MTFVREHIELLTGRPEHVEALKQHILSLAVRGLLVEQNPEDEPAGELVRRIRAEKGKMGKVGKLKKAETIQPVGEADQPYELPEGWVWCRLGEIGEINPRNAADDRLEASFAPMTLISERYGEPPEFEIRKWGEIKTGYTHFAENDVVFAKITPCFENSKAAIMRGLVNGIGAGTTELHVYRGFSISPLPEYIYLFFKTPVFLTEGERKMTGSAGQKRVPKDYVVNSLIPLPPLPEQRRIVAKVESLFSLIDRLSSAVGEGEELRRRWRGAVLRGLGEARDAQEMRMRWGQLSSHFDELIDSVEAVRELRQVVLQLAVRGVLVEQDPMDESAGELLRRIKGEKAKLGKKGESLPPVGEEERPYEVPRGWEWCRLGEVCKQITDGTHQTPKYTDQGRIFISAKNVKPFRFMPENCKYVSEEDYLKYIENRKPEQGDILLTRVGSNIGEAAKIDRRLDFAIYVSVALLKLFQEFSDPDYLLIWLNSPDGTEKSLKNTYGRGMSQGNLNLGLIKNFLFPLPPLSEQRRIVERVERLMGWCDGLEGVFEAREGVMGKVVRTVSRPEIC